MRWLQRSELGPSISWSQSWSVIVPPRRQGTLELDTAPLQPPPPTLWRIPGPCPPAGQLHSENSRYGSCGLSLYDCSCLSLAFVPFSSQILSSMNDLHIRSSFRCLRLDICTRLRNICMCRYLDYNILNPSYDSVPGQWLFLHSYETIINFTS